MKLKRDVLKHPEIKAFICAVVIFSFLEGFLWILEINNLTEEPYLWGNRNFAPYKINQCKRLFSDPQHKDKIKVVSVGDSVCLYAFNPYKFDEYYKNETISYNLAIKGTSVRFQSFFIQKVIVPKIKPDVIIWQLKAPNDFCQYVAEEETWNMRSPMARYYLNDFQGMTLFEFFDQITIKLSRIYKYRYFFLPNFLNLDLPYKEDFEDYADHPRGFKPKYLIYDDENETMRDHEFTSTFDEKVDDAFVSAINFMENQKIDYLVVSGPYYFERRIYKNADDLLDKLSDKNHLDLNGNEAFLDRDFFKDRNHLNFYGGQVFTHFISEKLDKILKSRF